MMIVWLIVWPSQEILAPLVTSEVRRQVVGKDSAEALKCVDEKSVGGAALEQPATGLQLAALKDEQERVKEAHGSAIADMQDAHCAEVAALKEARSSEHWVAVGAACALGMVLGFAACRLTRC